MLTILSGAAGLSRLRGQLSRDRDTSSQTLLYSQHGANYLEQKNDARWPDRSNVDTSLIN